MPKSPYPDRDRALEILDTVTKAGIETARTLDEQMMELWALLSKHQNDPPLGERDGSFADEEWQDLQRFVLYWNETRGQCLSLRRRFRLDPPPKIHDNQLEHLFHHLWGKAKESPGYRKEEWAVLHDILTRDRVFPATMSSSYVDRLNEGLEES